MNDQPFTLDFNTFCSSIGLDYNKGKYVAHPTFVTVKTTLGKIATNASYLDKTPVLKNSFPVAWRILFSFVIQVLGGNYSSIEQINSIQQMIAYCLITGTKVDIGEIIYSDLVTKLLNKSRLKYVSYPRFISRALEVLLGTAKTTPRSKGSLADKDLEGNKPPADVEPINPTVADPSGTNAKYQTSSEVEPNHETLQLNTLADIQAYLLSKDELAQESDKEEVFAAGDDMGEETQADEEEH
ncbi:hypothetical protein Tco_0454266 [Tanacetum coccineum]